MRDVDYDSLKIENLDWDEFPYFPSVRIYEGYTKDGWELTDKELKILNKDKELRLFLITRSINGY